MFIPVSHSLNLDYMPNSEQAARAYLTTLLWQGLIYGEEGGHQNPDTDQPFTKDDEPVNADCFEASDQAAEFAATKLEEFWESLPTTIRYRLTVSRVDMLQLAHDLALTQHHHGTGFWDRGADTYVNAATRDRINDIAQRFGEIELSLNADSEVIFGW